MAVDGEIHEDEIREIKNIVENSAYFLDFQYESKLKEFIKVIEKDGTEAINSYLNDLDELDFSEQQLQKLIDVLIRMIEADGVIDPNEIKFFQLVKSNLDLAEEWLIVNFPDKLEIILNDDHEVVINKGFDEDLSVIKHTKS